MGLKKVFEILLYARFSFKKSQLNYYIGLLHGFWEAREKFVPGGETLYFIKLISMASKNVLETHEANRWQILKKENFFYNRSSVNLPLELYHEKTRLKLNLCKTATLKLIGFQDQLSLNAGQKYCWMLQEEHSAILSTFSKLPFVIKIFVLSIFEWPLYTGLNVYPIWALKLQNSLCIKTVWSALIWMTVKVAKWPYSAGADPGFLERGFISICIEVWGLALLILSHFSLNIQWKWNNLVSRDQIITFP